MNFFEKYTSNTIAASANQSYFASSENEIKTGRIYYKISEGGSFNYSILFSNIIDSTFSDGSHSHCNLICDGWKIHKAKIGKCSDFAVGEEIFSLTAPNASDFAGLTFDGKSEKCVMPGEFFCSDPVRYEFKRGEYLCLEITFSGKMIPCHEETMLPSYVFENGGWKYSKLVPFAGMIGCDRMVKKRVAYFGDSITQGIGAGYNTYLHWNALLSQKLGSDYAYWNLGIGFGRAEDAASDGAWLYKAKQNDIVFVCFGVNDIQQGKGAEEIKGNIRRITEILKNRGLTVILQTVPPFDYEPDKKAVWEDVNRCIKNELAKKADVLFDNVTCLGEGGENSHMAKYGGHPDKDGCAVWAEELYKAVKDIF